jgi:hypothetical protein
MQMVTHYALSKIEHKNEKKENWKSIYQIFKCIKFLGFLLKCIYVSKL